MALIHPFIANEITCRKMKYRPALEDAINEENLLLEKDLLESPSARNFSCPMEKVEADPLSETGDQFYYKYYDFNQFLYVDLYEISLNTNSGSYENKHGVTPEEFAIPISAQNACNSFYEPFGGEVLQKRLLSRKEWFMASNCQKLIQTERLTILKLEAHQKTVTTVNT